MYDLDNFGLAEMISSGKQLRVCALNAETMQEAAGNIVDVLYTSFQSGNPATPSSALVRCFKTHPLGDLPPTLRQSAFSILAKPDPAPSMRCLTLLATRGDRPEWNSPASSVGHQVIPLPTAQIVEKAPMIARLILQLGLGIEEVVNPGPALLIDRQQQSFNVFHVEDALGSEFVPAQETFVIPSGVRSVLGFGGMLTSGELFVVVMFTKVKVSRDTAALFRTLALSVKLALLPFSGRQVFQDSAG